MTSVVSNVPILTLSKGDSSAKSHVSDLEVMQPNLKTEKVLQLSSQGL